MQTACVVVVVLRILLPIHLPGETADTLLVDCYSCAYCHGIQGQPIHRLAGPRLRALLAKARGLGGDRLTIDIMEAEAALRLFGRVEKSATTIQVSASWYSVCVEYNRRTAPPSRKDRLARVGTPRTIWNEPSTERSE